MKFSLNFNFDQQLRSVWCFATSLSHMMSEVNKCPGNIQKIGYSEVAKTTC